VPLNRVAKADVMALRERALVEIERLRSDGVWDR
jgi:hypothetical protein